MSTCRAAALVALVACGADRGVPPSWTGVDEVVWRYESALSIDAPFKEEIRLTQQRVAHVHTALGDEARTVAQRRLVPGEYEALLGGFSWVSLKCADLQHARVRDPITRLVLTRDEVEIFDCMTAYEGGLTGDLAGLEQSVRQAVRRGQR